MENVKKHRDIELVTTDEKRNKLVSEPSYHTTKCFSDNKPVYIGMSILDISKALMYKF